MQCVRASGPDAVDFQKDNGHVGAVFSAEWGKAGAFLSQHNSNICVCSLSCRHG